MLSSDQRARALRLARELDQWRVGSNIDAAVALLRELAAEPELQTCNCRWDGAVQVAECALHNAHVAAIHEWSERAKIAEAKIAAEPERVPLGAQALAKIIDAHCGQIVGPFRGRIATACMAVERAHGIGDGA